jgi:hypothetical protein
MIRNPVEVPEALQKVAKGNAHFTTSLYKVNGTYHALIIPVN